MRLLALLVTVVALLPGPVLAPVVLLVALAAAAFAIDCAKWPAVWTPPAGPTHPKGWNNR